jgi:hypothetical protein
VGEVISRPLITAVGLSDGAGQRKLFGYLLRSRGLPDGAAAPAAARCRMRRKKFSGTDENTGHPVYLGGIRMSEMVFTVALMTSTARRRASAPRMEKASPRPHDYVVPAVPGWARDWGVLVLVPSGILLLLVSLAIGADDGSGWGWALILAAGSAAAAIWLWDYRRRLRGDAERRDRELYELSEFTVVDQLRGSPDFELYCAGILPGMGYTDVEWIGRRASRIRCETWE